VVPVVARPNLTVGRRTAEASGDSEMGVDRSRGSLSREFRMICP